MKRIKCFVAWLMVICMLNLSGAWTGVSIVAGAADVKGYSYYYSDLKVTSSGNASADASGTASVRIDIDQNAAERPSEVIVPAAYTSGDASGNCNYEITVFKGISGDANKNVKVISFENAGNIPTIEGSNIENYYVKVLVGASADADLKSIDKDKLYIVDDLNNKIMKVENPKEKPTSFKEAEDSIKVTDILTDTDIKDGKTFTWYSDDSYNNNINNTNDSVEAKTYYYEVSVDGYAAFKGSIKMQNKNANAFTVKADNVTLTCSPIVSASGNAKVQIIDASADAAPVPGAPFVIPESVTNNNTTYTVTRICSNVFGNKDKNTKFTSYVIPESVTEIEANAFGNNLNYDDVVLLRFMATSKDKLPKISGNYNSAKRFGMVFNKSITESDINSWRNEKANNLNTNNTYFVDNPKTDKILMSGNVQAQDDALYTNHLSDIAITPTGFKDFETDKEVAVSGGWDNPGYAFSFADSTRDFPYTYKATGYANEVKGTKRITPYTASGFSYELVGAGLHVTEYNAEKDTVSTAEKKANKEVDIPASETDSTGASYTVNGIKTMNRNKTLEHLNIPAAVATINEDAFIGCDFMQINVSVDNAAYASANGFLYTKDMKKLISAACASGKTYLPAGIELIGDHAFDSNGRVQDLYIPASVTKIGESNDGHSLQATQLRDVYFFNSDNITTLTFMGSVFSGATRNIWVPTGTTAAYEAALKNQWKDATIREWIPTYDEIVTLTDYNEFPLTAVNGVNKTYTWTTSDANIVGVEATNAATAKIHAMTTTGTATITATSTDGSGVSKWQVTVNVPATLENPWAVPQYTLKATAKSLTMGAKKGKKVDSATITISASDKSAIKVASVKTSKKKVATVSKKGNKVVIKAAKKGKANITVTDSLGKTVTIKVTVKAAPKKCVLKKKSVKIKKGKTYKIALKNTASAKLTYKVSNKKIASVSGGVVKGKKKGSCKIIVTTYNGKKAVLKVKVK